MAVFNLQGMSLGTMKAENAWQSPAELYDAGSSDPLGLPMFSLVGGKELSYNNWADLDNALQTLTHIGAVFNKTYNRVPMIVLGVKHGSACGAGMSISSPEDAMKKMVEGYPLALFGGFALANFAIDGEAAHILSHHVSQARRILDGIAAPAFSEAAQKTLSRKNGGCRMLVNRHLAGKGSALLDGARRFRYVRGGFLAQENYTFVFNFYHKDVKVYGSGLGDHVLKDCLFAWAIGSTSKSNTITIAKDGKMLANMVGQQSRVGAAELAVMRALSTGHKIDGAVAYSDSFFPFTDGPEALVNAGITTIIATSGSIRDQEVIDCVRNAGVNLILAPDAQARGFYGH